MNQPPGKKSILDIISGDEPFNNEFKIKEVQLEQD